jgi:hypothetical protein
MDAIKILRHRAAAKRDDAIKAARQEFRDATRLLDQLDESLGQETPQRTPRNGRASNLALIAEVMPKDRVFEVGEILELLGRAHPGRDFPPATIRSEFTKLIDRGVLRKVRKTAKGCVQWAAVECEVVEEPLLAMTLADAASVVLDEVGPLTATELVVHLKERGYRPDDDPRVLLVSLRESFKRNRGRFVRGEAGRWNLGGA